MKKVLFAFGFCLSLPLLASACGDDDSTASDNCMSDAACAANEGNTTCDFRNGNCVQGCDTNADCGGNSPVCNADGANTMAPAVCVCDATSCPDGQVCTADGTCGTPTTCGMAGEQGACPDGQICQPDGTCSDGTCGEAGMQGSCLDGEVCLPNGSCATECLNGDGTSGCLATLSLCDTSTLSMTFNTCVAPQQLTGGCAPAEGHMMAMDGPVILGVELDGQINPPGTVCSASVQQFTADIFAPDGMQTSFFTPQGEEAIQQLRVGMAPNDVFSDGGGTPSHPSLTEVAGSDGRFELQFTLCLSQAQMMQQLAIFVRDSDIEDSNAACFFAQ